MKGPFKKALVGVDLSPNSIAAYHWFRRNVAGDARVKVVHAVDTPKIPGFIRKAFPHFDEWMTSMRRGNDDRLLELTRKDDVLMESREGPAVDVLLEAAAEFEADLLVVGAQGRHEGLGRLVGSTPERLLEKAQLPVLVVRGNEVEVGRILAALDDSPWASQAALLARDIARSRSIPLSLLTVVPTWFIDRIRFHAGDADAEERLIVLTREARIWLRERAKSLELGDDVEYLVETGAPDLEILHAAQRVNARMIVMGTRGEGLKAAPQIGSCARYLLRNAHVPVLFNPAAPDD